MDTRRVDITSQGSDFELEREELNAVLASGIFNRAPNLELVLTYVCAKHFEGAGEQIKEYNIAVEALGRPPGFDQKVDSIVRVEAHRLRKRLREYYAAEGAGHSVRIEIPPGQYAPKFARRGRATATRIVSEPEADVNLTEPIPDLAPAAPRPRRGRAWLWLGATIVLVLSVTISWRFARPPATRTLGTQGTAGPLSSAQSGDTIRILCGWDRGNYVDRFGNTWQNDRYFEGGTVFDTLNHPIRGSRDPRLYNIRREGSFRYDIPLMSGIYELRLHFAETVYGENNAAGGGETSRVFNVFVNGKEVLQDFDVVEDAGASTADVKVFKDISPAADGKLHLQFTGRSNPPILSGIEITPGIRGRMRPIRMVAQDRAYTDRSGQIWEPDRYASGGLLVSRNDAILGTPDPELYRGERFGNITYVIPVAGGRYGITLHFSETWFGPNQAAGGGAGSRVFDILCNGVMVKRNFDIYKEAGGPDRAVVTTLHDVEPNHQGKLVVSLVPVRNYASVNALEVVDESR